MNTFASLTKPFILYSRTAVLSKPCPVPSTSGLYAWYFKEIPDGVPTDDCQMKGDLTLLYIGISPKSEQSKENLRKRITYHFKGNAEGSTLRLTLGVLLERKSSCPLRRVGSGKRMTFTHAGEQWLDQWLEENAFVCWMEHPAPWEVEKELLQSISCPLNIQDNQYHPFSSKLSGLRKDARHIARGLPIAAEDNQQRS